MDFRYGWIARVVGHLDGSVYTVIMQDIILSRGWLDDIPENKRRFDFSVIGDDIIRRWPYEYSCD